jgi:hypothetical protein
MRRMAELASHGAKQSSCCQQVAQTEWYRRPEPGAEGEKHMMYFERNQPHWLVWPALAFGRDDLNGFWIGIGWLNMEIGWKEKNNG